MQQIGVAITATSLLFVPFDGVSSILSHRPSGELQVVKRHCALIFCSSPRPPPSRPTSRCVIESGQLKQIPSATTLQLDASTTAAAPLNIPQGTAPSSPNNGDCWTLTTGLYCYINGAVEGPFGSGTVTTTGTPASGNLAKFSGASSITNGDLSGDCTPAGALAITCTKRADRIRHLRDAKLRDAARDRRNNTKYRQVLRRCRTPASRAATQCVHADSSGNLTGTGADCGSSTGGSPLSPPVWRLDSASPGSTFANNFAAHGTVLKPHQAITVYAEAFVATTVTSGVYKVCAGLWDGTSKLSATPVCSNSWTVTTGQASESIAGTLTSPLSVAANQAFAIYVVRTDATATTSFTTNNTSTALNTPWPGLSSQSSTGAIIDLASLNPGTSDTWTTGNGFHVFSVLYSIN